NLVNDNTAWGDYGGCGFDYAAYDGTTTTMNGNQFNHNTAGGDYGGLFLDDVYEGGTFDFHDNQVIGNRAGISGTTHLGGNYAGMYMYSYYAWADLTNNLVLSNTAYLSGTTGLEGSYAGLYVYNQAALDRIADNVIAGNTAGGSTGAVYLELDYAGITTLEHNLIAANRALSDTAGIYVFDDSGNVAALYLRRNSLRDNDLTGPGYGPQVYALGASAFTQDFYLWSENNLIVGGNKGGVLANSADWHSLNDTVADNGPYAFAYTGTITSTLKLVNTIAWGQTADFSVLGGPATSVFTATFSILQHGNLGNASNTTTDPLFVGGGDYHLTAASPAINTANTGAAPATDLDGVIRPYGIAADRGAFEFALIKLFLPLLMR
ncbi:MAG: choice-of-anchor Q domain-containing protein, partial [Anaerolineales bacterium]